MRKEIRGQNCLPLSALFPEKVFKSFPPMFNVYQIAPSMSISKSDLWLWEVSILSSSGPTWAAGGLFLGDKHKNQGMDCSGCHKGNPPGGKVPMAVCLECHGDYRKVAQKTNKIDPNPHDSHLGEIDCEKCHHSHKTSVNVCTPCHQMDMKMP